MEIREEMKETGDCSICGKPYGRWGNNAQPVNEGRCCDHCNTTAVMPARLANLGRVRRLEPEPESKLVN